MVKSKLINVGCMKPRSEGEHGKGKVRKWLTILVSKQKCVHF